MEINTKICPFETVYSDKCEIENETEYSLSELGETLIPVITSIREWGVMYFERAGVEIPHR